MKNTLMVPLVFVLYFVLWTLVLSFFSVLGISTQIENLFSGAYKIFISSLVYHTINFVPISLIFAFVSTFLYIVRHPTLLLLTIPIVVILAFLSVFFFIPFSYKVAQYLIDLDLHTEMIADTQIKPKTEPMNFNLPPAGLVQGDSYYRLIWFVQKENPTAFGPLVIVNSESRQVYPVLTVFPEVSYSPENRILISEGIQRTRSLPHHDSHLIEMLKRPSFLDAMISDIKLVEKNLKEYWNKGRVVYVLNAGSLFFMILSFSSISYLTGWRLLNGLLSFFLMRLLFLFYPFLSEGSFYDSVSSIVDSFLPSFLITPVLCVLLSVVFLIIGFLSLLTQRTKKIRPENRYE